MSSVNDQTNKMPHNDKIEDTQKKGLLGNIADKLTTGTNNAMSSVGIVGDPSEGVEVDKQMKLSKLSQTWVDPHAGDETEKENQLMSNKNETDKSKYKGTTDITKEVKGGFPTGYQTELASKNQPVEEKL